VGRYGVWCTIRTLFVLRKEDGLFATSLQILENTSSLENQNFVDTKHCARGLFEKEGKTITLFYCAVNSGAKSELGRDPFECV